MASGNEGAPDGDGYGDQAGYQVELQINEVKSEVSRLISAINAKELTAKSDSSSNAEPGLQVAPSQTNVIIMGVTDDGDIIPLDESRVRELELNNDPDSDGGGLMDALESASYSFSLGNTGDESERTEDQINGGAPCGAGMWGRTTGGSAKCSPENSNQENPLARQTTWQESPQLDVAPPADVLQWTYKLNTLSGDGDLPKNGILTVIITGGKVYFNVHFDPDSDEDGYADMLRNSSFSISKRSARTGRNPQSSRE
jgi:hypothetical protein